MSHDCKAGKDLFIGFLSGTFLGAAIALLYAPKSGRKMRRDLNNKVQDLRDDVEEFLHIAKKKAGAVVNDGITKAEQLVSDVKSKTDELLTDANKIMSDAKGKVTAAAK